jgi:hypothetical protein
VAVEGVTVAVKVTGSPSSDGLAEPLIVMLEGVDPA